MKILIVEDEEGSRVVTKMVTKELYIAGADFKEAKSMSEAQQLLEKETPDIMLLDLRLPDSSTGETLSKISEFKQKGISVMVLTGYASSKNIEKALEYGADQVLNKEDAYQRRVLVEKIMEVYKKRINHNIELIERVTQWKNSQNS